jgi:D-xylulose reductase
VEATNLTSDAAWKAGHGTLRKSVVHPAAFTFALPDNVSLEWGAMVEPLSVGMHAATLAAIKPGDTAVIMGAGPIGMMTALSAVAGGCSKVYVFDPNQTKAKIAETLAKGKVIAVNVAPKDLAKTIRHETDGGADVVFECAGNTRAAESTFDLARPGGKVLLIGCPPKDPVLNMAAVQMSELTVMGIFRYRNVYPQAIRLLSSGSIDLTPIITDRFTFDESVDAFKYMTKPKDTTVKSVIRMPGAKN